MPHFFGQRFGAKQSVPIIAQKLCVHKCEPRGRPLLVTTLSRLCRVCRRTSLSDPSVILRFHSHAGARTRENPFENPGDAVKAGRDHALFYIKKDLAHYL